MMSVEEAIGEKLRRSGPCCLDDVLTTLHKFSSAEVFLAVYQMSRDGRVSLRQVGHSTYRLTLRGVAQGVP